MRAREVKLWLDALVEFHGNDEFDREVAAHVVRVLELVEGTRGQRVHTDATEAEGEMWRCTLKLLKARADTARRAQEEKAAAYLESLTPA